MPSPRTASPPRPSTPPESRGAVRAVRVLVLCSALLTLAVVVEWGPLVRFDRTVADTTHRWALAEPGVTHLLRVLTDWVWDPWTMRLLSAVAVVWLWARRRDRWTAGWLAATCLLGAAAQQGLKAAVDRPRPVWAVPVDSARYAAFPSGHAMTATFVCLLLVWLLYRHGASRGVRRTAVALAALSVAGVGFTRVWLGVHWTTDVVGGWLLGALVAALAVLAHRRWRPWDRRPARAR
ncbi:phosphatase PAP2 family protein [Streptomyces sp. SHP 1-2]|uniref:phosphatase PAP2 family protein n=2 Tax=unclassified Streptomyces TaxID=2593676 RepID=UPI002238C8D7|nr:phosphatase PAP2 family protein [Streptomyces sp. SHP 1-2]MCW5251270.1 phosphatase PAP2 family protein [Streptomyces sp. SHP 1-2]